MDLKRLKYFCAIIEQGQISRAAKVLNIAQPPLSKRLKELEEELEVELIKRGGGQWEITEAGHRLYRRAHAILSEVDGLTDELRSDADELLVANIGISSTCASFLHKPMRRLRKEHPGARIRVVVGSTCSLEALLRTKAIDIAIMQSPEESAGILRVPLKLSRIVAAIPSALINPEWEDEVSLAEISRHPLLLLRRASGHGSYEKIMDIARRRGLHLDVFMECDCVWTIRETLVELGNVIAVLPETEVIDNRPPNGAFFPINEPDLFFEPSLFWQEGRPPTGVTKLLIDYMLDEANSTPKIQPLFGAPSPTAMSQPAARNDGLPAHPTPQAVLFNYSHSPRIPNKT